MTFVEFCCAVRCLCRLHKASVTSWGRTVAHNIKVGGKATSWHLDFMAVDLELDHPESARVLKIDAERLGFDAVIEDDHVHLEPSGPR